MPETNRSIRLVTGKAVVRLRAKFGMSQSEFARLLGVSAPTIGNWENKTGRLALQARSLDALEAVKQLTKQQARRKLVFLPGMVETPRLLAKKRYTVWLQTMSQ
jgi:DNA-binding transcriptional regulator YiaG